MKKPMKFKRYNGEDGSEVEEAKAKERGLEISNRDDPKPSGFLEGLKRTARRFTEGNIDTPGSEAYNKYGAGRGRSEVPAEKVESAPEAPAKIIPRPSIQMRPAERALSDDMYSDYGSKVSTSETIRPSKPMVTASEKPVVSKPTVKQEVKESVFVNEPKTSKKSSMSAEEVMEAENPKGRSPFSEKPKETQKPKTQKSPSLTAFPKNEESRRMMSEGVGKAISGATSGIVDYFSGLKSTPERKAQNRKMEKLKADPTSRERDLSKGGSVSSASRRADGIATKGKTRGKMC